jgi:hypothetical protein
MCLKKSSSITESIAIQQIKKRKASQGTIPLFDVDRISSEEKNGIDLLVTKFFIGCNISLNQLESVLFEDMVKALRPSYVSPNIEHVKNQLINNVYKSVMEEVCQSSNSSGTLIVELKESSVAFVLKPRYSDHIFMKSDEFCFDIEQMLKEVLEQAEKLYSVKVEFVCWVSSSPAPVMDVSSYRCVLSSVESILTLNEDSSLKEKVKMILDDFGSFHVPEDLNYVGAMTFFINNIEKLRKLDVEDESPISEDSKKLLYDRNWIEEVRKENKKFGRIQDFLIQTKNNNHTLSEAAQNWFEMNCGESLNDDEMKCEAKIIANTLDHRFKGLMQNSQEKHIVTTKMLMMLRSTEKKQNEITEYAKFLQYRQNKGEFSNIDLQELSPQQYWESLADYAPKLSELGLRYTSLPSKIYKNQALKTSWNDFSLDLEHREQALFIYNSLKLK